MLKRKLLKLTSKLFASSTTQLIQLQKPQEAKAVMRWITTDSQLLICQPQLQRLRFHLQEKGLLKSLVPRSQSPRRFSGSRSQDELIHQICQHPRMHPAQCRKWDTLDARHARVGGHVHARWIIWYIVADLHLSLIRPLHVKVKPSAACGRSHASRNQDDRNCNACNLPLHYSSCQGS